MPSFNYVPSMGIDIDFVSINGVLDRLCTINGHYDRLTVYHQWGLG